MTHGSHGPPFVSVAMATYNGAEFIAEQLRSLASQTRPPDELVVTDDGSVDDTVDRIATFARSAPFEVRVSINDERLGYTQNFAAALRRCRGDIIFMCDQDDVWADSKIERVLRTFDERPAAQLVVHDRIVVDRDLTSLGATELDNFERLGRSTDGYVSGCCTAVRRGFLDAVLPIPSSAQSYDAWIHHLAHLLHVREVLLEPLLYHRRHGANTSGPPTSTVKPVNPLLGRAWGLAHKIGRARRRSHAGTLSVNATRSRAIVQHLDAIIDDPVRRAGFAPETLAHARDEAAALSLALELRGQYVALPRWRRIGRILAAVAQGHYREFDAPGAIILDLVARPGPPRVGRRAP